MSCHFSTVAIVNPHTKKKSSSAKSARNRGHVAKVYKGGNQKGKEGQARQAKEKEEDSSDSDGEEVKAARVGTATPPFML